jgi:hypothetical protein
VRDIYLIMARSGRTAAGQMPITSPPHMRARNRLAARAREGSMMARSTYAPPREAGYTFASAALLAPDQIDALALRGEGSI